jgi:hypothetical protein
MGVCPSPFASTVPSLLSPPETVLPIRCLFSVGVFEIWFDEPMADISATASAFTMVESLNENDINNGSIFMGTTYRFQSTGPNKPDTPNGISYDGSLPGFQTLSGKAVAAFDDFPLT